MSPEEELFVPISQNTQAVCVFYLQGRYMLGEEETANTFLCIVSFKHRLLKPLEFQKGPGDTFLLQETLLHDDSHDTKVALHSYVTMKQQAKGNKWRQEKHKSPLYPSLFLPHLPEGAAVPSCAVPEKIAVPWLASAILNLFHVALEESAQSSALNKHPLHSSTVLFVFQASCHLPSVTQSLVVLNPYS